MFFHLQKQQLIEMIRAGKIEEGLAFAQEFLAYKGEESQEFLEELGAPALIPSCHTLMLDAVGMAHQKTCRQDRNQCQQERVQRAPSL